ncbi:hypothetical protein CFC21_004982 [Triticum aestivum]|uniref:Bowman-Birk serine protease inhibitors family domain-containing protein n=1 Tax=Triticum aestivum TaxID=4565 RepID=A0A9R1D8U8_WHEAT|nr:hypothetical protein CFC21_004982 [Triticum aestivum]
MSPVGSSTLAHALKAATIAAILATLVLPSLGRCQSVGQEELVTAPAPAMRCSECGPHCTEMCRVSVPPKCSQDCDVPSCEDCRSAVIRDCRARCKAGGCDCDGYATQSCTGSCFGSSSCSDCMRLTGKQCTSDCNSKCAATCV